MEVVKGRGYVYSIQYHIVWCVKYRRDVLNGQVAIKLKELLTQISKDNGFQILEMNIEEDYIHMPQQDCDDHGDDYPGIPLCLRAVRFRQGEG